MLGSLSCCMTQFWPCYSCHKDGLTFDSGILWYTEGFMVDSVTVRDPGPVATKKAQTHQPFTSMLEFWYEMFVLISFLAFTKCGAVHYCQTSPLWTFF